MAQPSARSTGTTPLIMQDAVTRLKPNSFRINATETSTTAAALDSSGRDDETFRHVAAHRTGHAWMPQQIGGVGAMKPQRYGPFSYLPIHRRPPLKWPDGKRLAFWVIPNIEVFALDERMPPMPGGSNGIIPDVHTWSVRDYGARVGVFRLMEVMAHHGVRGTVALNSEVCDAYPEIIEEAVRLKWEFMGHNQSNTRRLNEIPPETEKAVIEATCARIAEATGRRPAGWLGSGLQETWNTLDYLTDAGCSYVSDWVNDDQPYLMNVGGRRLVSVPYSSEINDKPAFEAMHVTPDEFAAMIRRQFEVLYRESIHSGRVMAIALHPYITGVPHRIDALDAAIRHICRHDDVWLATGEEIARHYLTTIER